MRTPSHSAAPRGEDVGPLLQAHGVRPTGNRVLVARALLEAEAPLSLSDLEAVIGTVDKSNIFRALALFRERRLVHTLEDETGALRYEICSSGAPDADDDLHVHFFCRRCRKMSCLERLPIPAVDVPRGYRTEAATYVVKGLCPKCAASAESRVGPERR